MQTILCEKPDAAKKFRAALGGRTGQNANVGTGEPYEIVHAVGHLFELKPLDQMVDQDLVPQFTSWAIKDLPFDHNKIHFALQLKADSNSKKYKPSEYHAKLFKEIKSALDKSDTVIIATDVDPSGEGDLLAWEIINACGFKGKVLRASMVDDTAPKIKECLLPKNLRAVTFQDPIVQSALARQKFDFFTIQYSRASTSLSQDNQVLPQGGVIREGRFKSAMTALVGKREEEYDTFKPSSAYELAYFDDDKRKFIKPKQDRFKTPAMALQANAQKYPDLSTVKFVKKEDKQITPPGLYDLMKLSGAIAARGHDTSTFMKTYQKMYEAHYVTYPRTEDKIITPDQLNEFKQVLPQIVNLLDIDPKLINVNQFASKNLYNPNSKSAAPSHGANRPGSKVPVSLDMLKEFGPLGPVIYEICARQILASFGDNKINEVTTYSDASSDFIHRVVENKEPGWTLILKDTSADDKDSDDTSTSHPTAGAPLHLSTNEVKAKRPSLYTEASLAAELEKYNVGTGATRKNTLDDVLYSKPNRKLVKKDGSRLRLSPLGQLSFVLMQKTYLADILFTQQLNTFLEKIRSGEAKLSQTNDLFKKMFSNDLPKVKENVKFLSSFPKQKSRAGFPKATHLYKPTGENITFAQGAFDHAYTEAELEALLDGKTIKVPAKAKSGAAYIAVGKLENDPTYGWGFRLIDREFAPRKRYSGTYKPTQEEISFEAQFGAHEFTDSECKRLLAGEGVSVSGKSKATGKPYTMDVTLQLLPPYKDPAAPKVWQAAPKQSQASEKHTQQFIPTNEQVSIPKVFMQHAFTTPEFNELFTGNPIVIPTVTKAGVKGKHTVSIQVRPNFNAPGKSLQLGFHEDPNDFVKITPPGQTNKVEIKKDFLGHVFSDDELKALSAGDSVKFDAKSKAGKDYTAEVELVHSVPFRGKTKTWHVDFVPRNR